MIVAPLLHPDDPHPFGLENPEGTSPIRFVADHAGRAIPRQLGNPGLGEAELSRHIGYDIGIHAVTSELARNLNATYIFQPYPRMVIDCHRKLGRPQSIVMQSDVTVVPSNARLDPDAVRQREDEILRPHQDHIETTLKTRAALGQPTVLFATHSYTDRLRLNPRPCPWKISVIADRDLRLGTALVEVLRAEAELCIGVNEPYTVNMAMEYTVPIHAEVQGLPYVEIEIRQDLIGDAAGQQEWAKLLTRLFPIAAGQARIVAT